MTKRALALGLSLAMMLGLVGCGAANQEQTTAGTEQQIEESDGLVELTVWGSADDQSLLQKMVDGFLKEYEGQAQFEISVEKMDEEKCQEAVLGNMAEAADVFVFRHKQLEPLVAAGALSAVPGPDAVERETSQYAFAAASFDGTLYAYPMATTGGYVVYHNKEYITATEAATVDSILYKADTLGKKMAMDWTSAEVLYTCFGNADLTITISDDGKSNETNFDALTGINKGIDIAQGFADIVYTDDFVSLTIEETLEAAKTGEVVAFVGSQDIADEVKAIWGSNYGVVKLPRFSLPNGTIEMGSPIDYRLVGVNTYADDTDWAHKLAAYLTNEESQTLRLKEKGERPCNSTVASSTEAISNPIIKAMNEQEKFCVTFNTLPGYEEAFADFAQWMIDSRFEPHEDVQDKAAGITYIKATDRVSNLQPVMDALADAIRTGGAFVAPDLLAKVVDLENYTIYDPNIKDDTTEDNTTEGVNADVQEE